MRKTKQQAQEAKEAEERSANTKRWLTEQAQQALSLRSKDREFHGLEREIIDYQEDLERAYEKSKDIKHPRDAGDVREALLRAFLTETGLLPKRYAVSTRRVRVASTSGHMSGEMDIALYDDLDSISLMKRSDIYEVLPVESVYGVIQVKSTLTKPELQKGLANIASFKSLKRRNTEQKNGFNYNNADLSDKGFGLIFAYDCEMDWADVRKTIDDFAKEHDHSEWTNAIFVLKKGFFMHAQDGYQPAITNADLMKMNQQQSTGRQDLQNLCLWNFYQALLTLLRGTTVSEPLSEQYFSLPLLSGKASYQFQLGHHAEVGTCSKNPKHGSYQRKISPENLQKIVQWCSSTKQIDLMEEEEKLHPRPASIPMPKRKQVFPAYLYNPDKLPMKDVLQVPAMLQGRQVAAIGYDIVITEGATICIPYVYSGREGLISSCPDCLKATLKGTSKNDEEVEDGRT